MPDLWPATLRVLVAEAGALGAAYVVWNKQTNHVEWVSFAGPGLDMKAEFVAHYAALAPIRPVLNAAPAGKWLRLTECVPQGLLARDEWYNDFLIRSHIADLVVVRLVDGESRSVSFGFHLANKTAPLPAKMSEIMEMLVEPLSRAAVVHLDSLSLGWKSAAALRVLDLIGVGLVLVEADGRVVEMSRAAEQMVSKHDGLVVRDGRLTALRTFENAKLAKFMTAAATALPSNRGISGHMLVARAGEERLAYVVKVTQLGMSVAWHDHPLAMVLVIDPEQKFPSEARVSEVFGLSPAESRVAAGLLRGQTLAEIGERSGTQLTTLRTQLSSVLRKLGVKRQQDLVSTLSAIRVIESTEL
jgi:DNA-binding CsgD family transcriptional regulator